jgi:hypothetical protein
MAQHEVEHVLEEKLNEDAEDDSEGGPWESRCRDTQISWMVWPLARMVRTLASASHDNTVRLWEIDPNAWISRTCAIVNRNLSLAEWQQDLGANIPYREICPELPPGKGAPQ